MAQSRAASSRYAIGCPVCSASPLEPCRTLTTGRVTDTHLARIDAWWAAYQSAAVR